jgi:hypothetical protein
MCRMPIQVSVLSVGIPSDYFQKIESSFRAVLSEIFACPRLGLTGSDQLSCVDEGEAMLESGRRLLAGAGDASASFERSAGFDRDRDGPPQPGASCES